MGIHRVHEEVMKKTPDGSSLGDIRATDASILNASIHELTNQSGHLSDNNP